MKKGQLFGQIFIYIVAIIIVAFLLVFGYRAITTFKDKADQVSLIQLKNDLEKTIEVISLDFGSVKVKEFILPENIKKICFVPNHEGMPALSGTDYPLIEDSVNSGVSKNVFLISDTVEESFSIGPIKTPENLFCVISIRNAINLRLEGKGNHAVITAVS